MSHRLPEDRRQYARIYYRRHAKELCANRRRRQQVTYWCAWLLNELRTNWPPEPRPVFAADLRDALMDAPPLADPNHFTQQGTLQ